MPIVTRSQTIAANATVENLIAGSEFEFAPGPQRVAIGLLQDAVVGGNVDVTIQFGSEVIGSAGPIPVAAAAGLPVSMDQHMYYQDVAAGGDRIKITVRETAGVAVPIRMLMQTVPIG